MFRFVHVIGTAVVATGMAATLCWLNDWEMTREITVGTYTFAGAALGFLSRRKGTRAE